jgi:hypothetical protein
MVVTDMDMDTVMVVTDTGMVMVMVATATGMVTTPIGMMVIGTMVTGMDTAGGGAVAGMGMASAPVGDGRQSATSGFAADLDEPASRCWATAIQGHSLRILKGRDRAVGYRSHVLQPPSDAVAFPLRRAPDVLGDQVSVCRLGAGLTITPLASPAE